MLKEIDASKKLKKADFREKHDPLSIRLGELQRACIREEIPTIIIFEGWSASGKASRIGSLIQCLDPRGFEVFTTEKATENERLRPYLWRFWQRTPAKGRIHIFDRSWYRALIRGSDADDAQLANPEDDIKSFEKTLTDSGTLIIKLFLHVTKKEQRKRLISLAGNPETAWRVKQYDWVQNYNYDAKIEQFEEILCESTHETASWTVIEADDRRYADIKVLQTVCDFMKKAVEEKRNRKSEDETISDKSAHLGKTSVLCDVDLSRKLGRDEYAERLKSAQNMLALLHNDMYLKRVPMAIVFEGWDAGGKGGAIRRTVRPLDPRGYKVAPYGAPTGTESSYNYLWRFWREIPKAGHLTVFDRSWYGRVMVERVEGFCSETEWRRAFDEINDFEKQLVDSGIVLVKFWLHISAEEQLRRFNERMNTPSKNWKITDEDWRNREKWNMYLDAVDEMLHKTSTAHAPWTIVEADDKLHARVKVIETVRQELENRFK